MAGTATTGASASQAWAILKRHARDEISPLRLKDLCRDNDRVSSLVSVHNGTPDRMLLIDLSRQRMTLETLNHLLRLAATRDIRKYVTRLAWGQNDPENPVMPARIRNNKQKQTNKNNTFNSRSFDNVENTPSRRKRPTMATTATERPTEPIPSFHLSLRVPANRGHEMLNSEGHNLLTGIHSDWDRIRRISDSIRRGQLPGVTGSMIRDVVIVGRGVSIMSLRFVYLALCKDQTANVGRRSGIAQGIRRIKFVTSVDPIRAAAAVSDLDPASALIITINVYGNEETSMTTQTLRSWLLQSLGGRGGGTAQQPGGKRHDVILSHHTMLVTGSEKIASANKPESVFLLPEHSRSEPFATFTAATLLVSSASISVQYATMMI